MGGGGRRRRVFGLGAGLRGNDVMGGWRRRVFGLGAGRRGKSGGTRDRYCLTLWVSWQYQSNEGAACRQDGDFVMDLGFPAGA